MDNRSFEGFRFVDLESAAKTINFLLTGYDRKAEEYKALDVALYSILYIEGIIAYLSLKNDVETNELSLSETMKGMYQLLGLKFSQQIQNVDEANAFSSESLTKFKNSIATIESLHKSMIEKDLKRYDSLELATSIMRYLSQESNFGFFESYLERMRGGLTEEELDAYYDSVDSSGLV